MSLQPEVPPSRRNAHALSQRSIIQKRDAFLFYDLDYASSVKLCLGLDTARHNISIATFYRWLDILDDDPDVEFQLWRIDVVKIDIFTYSAQREGLPLPRSSTEPLALGDYGAYSSRQAIIADNHTLPYFTDIPKDDQYVGKDFGPGRYYPTFEEREAGTLAEQLPNTGEPLSHIKVPENMKRDASERDGGVCFFQGVSTNETTHAWLVPPTFSYYASLLPQDDRGFQFELTKLYKNLHNVITLDEKLRNAFLANKFAIDVDDDYKFIIFQDFPGSEELTRNHRLPPISVRALNDSSRLHLKENFKYCLGVNILGGDIREDHPDLGRGFAEEVAKEFAECHEIGSPNDEKWKTPLGREYLDFHRDKDWLPDEFRVLLQ